MDISCDIIRDLLPLYAEDLVSEDSKKLVDEHLFECDRCMKELGVLKKVAQLPVEVDTGSLKRVENMIRRRRILSMLTVVLFIITLGLSIALFLDAKIYLTADQAVESVEVLEDGRIRIAWTKDFSIAGICQFENIDPYSDESTGNIGIIAWAPLANLLFPRKIQSYGDMMAQLPEDLRSSYPVTAVEYNASTYQLEGGASSQNFWYCSAKDGTAQTLLWEAGNPAPESPFIEVNYHMAYYCAILATLAALLVIPGCRFKSKWYGELCIRLVILFGCLSLSAVIVSAGQFMELYGEFTEHVIDSTIVAVPMTLTVLFARQLYKLNKQDKGL